MMSIADTWNTEGEGNDKFTLDKADFKVPLGNTGTCMRVEPEDLVKGWR